MAAKVIRTPRFYRTLNFDPAQLDEKTRSVPCSFSSETPVQRALTNDDKTPYNEILDHSADSVDLTDLRSGAPVLVNHNPNDQVGVVENPSIENGVGRAVLRFGNSPRANEIFQDVKDGIRRSVSVGYTVSKYAAAPPANGLPSVRAMNWRPREISIASIPADNTVGIGRTDPTQTTETEIIDMKRNLFLDPDPKDPTGALAEAERNTIRTRTQTEERTRINEITTIGRTFNVPEADVTKFITEGKPVDAFRTHVLEVVQKAKPAPVDPNIGMSNREIKRYSLTRAISRIGNKQQLDGLELEASRAVAKLVSSEPEGFFVPHDVNTRDLSSLNGLTAEQAFNMAMSLRALNATTATAGGYLVGTDVLTGSMIELLRNKTKVAQLGARMLSGLMGNVAIPKLSGGATAYWLSENGTVTKTDQTFGQLGLTPHRLVAATAFSKQLVAQTTLSVEALVRDDIMRVLAIAKDLAAINGTGANGQPLGIINTTGIGSVTFGGAATWAKVVSFETALATANIEEANCAYLTTPAVRGKWKTTQKATNYPIYIWEDAEVGNGSGRVNGYRAESTNQVPNDLVIFADWSQLIMADWNGLDVVVDPYTLADNSQVKVTVNLNTDNGARHAVGFCVSADSGAQ